MYGAVPVIQILLVRMSRIVNANIMDVECVYVHQIGEVKEVDMLRK